jgi:hypothetical protein
LQSDTLTARDLQQNQSEAKSRKDEISGTRVLTWEARLTNLLDCREPFDVEIQSVFGVCFPDLEVDF